MRHRFILLAVGLSVAGVLAMGSSTQARAGGNGATVIRDDGTCFVSDSAGHWLFSCNIQFVIQPDGTINHHITGSVIPEESSPLASQPVTDFTGPALFRVGRCGAHEGHRRNSHPERAGQTDLQELRSKARSGGPSFYPVVSRLF